MGRIEDALRRSGDSGSNRSAVSPDSELFVSPWSVPTAPAPPAHEKPVTVVSRTSEASDATPGDEPANSFDEAAMSREPVGKRPDLLTGSTNADAVLSGQFRRMAARLYNAQDENLKLVMVTSAAPGEGKTTTTMNLALILSQSFRQRVLLIDADLRRPSIHRAWGLTETEGLGDILDRGVDYKPFAVGVSDTLTVLPAGSPFSDPTGVLTSDRMRAVLAESREQFDWVVVDTPPVVSVDDATLLGSMVDAVLFVVRARATRLPIVRNAVDSIGRDRIFGIVLNGTAIGDSTAYGYYYGYGYGYGYGTRSVSTVREA